MADWLETDSASNVDISSATKIGEYTATGDRFVMAQVFVDQVAGNGDYELYATLKIGGSGSAYRFIPITSAKAASGVTAIGAVSGWIPVRSGDVVAIYIDGLAGDNTTPDVVVRWFAQQLAADVGGLATSSALSSLDGKVDALPTPLDAAGIRAAVGLALANLDSQLGAIPTAAPLDAAGTRAAVGLSAANLDTQLSLLATAAALTTVAGNILALPGVADIADGLWDELLSGHTIAGSAGEALAQAASGSGGGGGGGGLTKADVRDALGLALANLDNQLDGLSNAIGAVGNQLDSVPYCIPGNPVTGGPGDMPRIDLRGVQGDTTQWAITGLDLTGATKVWITAKDALWKDDAHAVFQVDDAGLTVLAEQVAAHPEWGALTIIDADSIAVMLDENATRVVPGNVKLLLDIQKQTAGGITTIAIGTVEFRKDVTWTI